MLNNEKIKHLIIFTEAKGQQGRIENKVEQELDN